MRVDYQTVDQDPDWIVIHPLWGNYLISDKNILENISSQNLESTQESSESSGLLDWDLGICAAGPLLRLQLPRGRRPEGAGQGAGRGAGAGQHNAGQHAGQRNTEGRAALRAARRTECRAQSSTVHHGTQHPT